MITQQHLASFKHADRDQYAREKVLNSAIIAGDISSGWEEYLEILTPPTPIISRSPMGRKAAGIWQGAEARTPSQIPRPDSCNG